MDAAETPQPAEPAEFVRPSETTTQPAAELSTQEKLFLLVTLCANTIAETIWLVSNGHRALALDGVDAIVAGIKDNIRRRTEERLN